MSAEASEATATGTVIFSIPIAGSATHDRVIVEIDEGNWQIGRVPRADRATFERECGFSMAELQQVAVWGLEGNTGIAAAFNKQPGKGLAAGIVLLMMAVGLIKTETAA